MARKVLEMGSRFQIGDGKSARIWGDRWVPRPTTFVVITHVNMVWRIPGTKLNFDGAFDPTLGRGAVGVVARDADGGFGATMAKSIGEVQLAKHAEILAAREGLALALSLRIASPIFEGDSAVVVAAVKRAGQ
ncbi:unnamed protein product, partial [Prunus brigantina]